MTNAKLTILVVDDEPNMRRIMEATLRREGYGTIVAANGREALDILKRQPVHVLLTDLKMPEIDGMTLLRECHVLYPDIPIIMLTAHGTVETAVEAMKIGASDFISKPFDVLEVRQSLQKATGRYLRNRESYHSSHELVKGVAGTSDRTVIQEGGIVARSKAMREALSLIERVADSPSTILITGESGTGKELVAGLIHGKSSRRDYPLIKVNCAAIPETLLESEFFGHERGAFTGAVTSKPGRFELANEGTLFLDEISEVSPEIQVKLLRVIQEREFERVGGIKTTRVDVRLIAATNLNLSREVEEGRFRRDLFYRLNVIPIHLSPLRDRIEDIPPLVDYFITRMNQRLKRDIQGVSDAGMQVLMQHSWPGNIRELENVIERAVLLSSADILEPEVFNLETLGADSGGNDELTPPGKRLQNGDSFKEIMQDETDRIERDLVVQALTRTHGNVTRASQLLGISRKGLQLKMKRYDIDPRNLVENPDFPLT